MNDTNMHPQKILLVSNSCWSMYNFRIEVIEHFLKLGYEVHIAASRDDFAIKLLNTGCKVHNIRFNNRRLNPLADINLFFQLKHLYKQIRPALIFHYVIKPNIYGSIAASQLNIPSIAVVTGLGYSFASNNWLSSLVIKLYRFALKHVRYVVMLNEEDKRLFIDKRILTENKIKLLQSEGINLERFKPAAQTEPNSNFIFLMATRMLWSKGVGIFAEAAELLKNKGLSFECKVIGFFEPNHPDSIPIEQLENWRNKNIFSYLGFTENVVPFFNQANCFVLPTYYHEGVPRSLLEACAMQVPVITSNNIGCKEVVKDGYNGFICEINNAAALSEKMELMLQMKNNQLTEMGINGRKLVFERFNINLITAEYNKFLQI